MKFIIIIYTTNKLTVVEMEDIKRCAITQI